MVGKTTGSGPCPEGASGGHDARVSLRDGFITPLGTVAGICAIPGDATGTVRAAVVVFDARDLQPIDRQVVELPLPAVCVDDPASFRQLPAMLDALARLPRPPDLLLVAGDGIAHPRRFGLACALGVQAGLPCIGIATRVMAGTAAPLHLVRGAYTALRDGREQIGWLLRSQAGGESLVVSPGHRVAMASAADLVMRFVTTGRLPEPLRLAEGLAAGCGEHGD
jgi:deoxyribonuclease V